MPKIRSQLPTRRVGSVAPVTIRVVELISVKDVLRNQRSASLHKQRKVEMDGFAILQRVEIIFRDRLTLVAPRLKQDPSCDFHSLRLAQVRMGGHASPA